MNRLYLAQQKKERKMKIYGEFNNKVDKNNHQLLWEFNNLEIRIYSPCLGHVIFIRMHF